MDEQTTPQQPSQTQADPFEQGPNRIVPPQEQDVLVEDVLNEAVDAAAKEESQISDAQAAAMVEAVLFATDAPLTAAKIAQVTKISGQRAVKDIIVALNTRYEQMGCAFRIEAIAGGYQMLTGPEFHDVLGRLLRVRSETRLSPSALETLSIVAYRQPILRADIESIRGVASGEMLRGLMERQLVKIVGRAEVIGRPMLYGTTRRFLEIFGLASLEDLPNIEALRSGDKASKQNPVADAPDATTTATRNTDEPATDQSMQTTEQAPPTAEQIEISSADSPATENPLP